MYLGTLKFPALARVGPFVALGLGFMVGYNNLEKYKREQVNALHKQILNELPALNEEAKRSN